MDNGLIAHPDGRTLIYPLGSTIVLRDKKDPKAQEFLQGHSDKASIECKWLWPSHGVLTTCCPAQVSTLALSKSGRYLASGQVTYMGFTADVIIWDLETRQLLHRLSLHKVRFLDMNS